MRGNGPSYERGFVSTVGAHSVRPRAAEAAGPQNPYDSFFFRLCFFSSFSTRAAVRVR